MSSNPVEVVNWDDRLMAFIVRRDHAPAETTFVTPAETNLQLGFVVYPEGGEISAHSHHPVKRSIEGTCEVLIVRKGRCEMDLYSPTRELIATYELTQGDVVMMIDGGHGFRALEDLTLIEIKQGPYGGLEEKERY